MTSVTGSACFSRHSEPSHVLTAMGLSYLSYLEASSALRISVGKDNTQDQDQIDRASAIIIESVQRILSISGMG